MERGSVHAVLGFWPHNSRAILRFLICSCVFINFPVHLALTVFPDPSLACNPYNSSLPFIHLDKMGLLRDEVVGSAVGGLKRLCTLGCSLRVLKVCSANIRRTS